MVKSVIVVGGGLAGLSATAEAAANGAKVTLVEKEKAPGGNSAKATSGINGAVTEYQVKRDIQDSLESFEDDTLKSGHGLCKTDLVDVLVKNSKEAVEWVSSHGLDLSNLSQCGGHSAPRTHREPARADGKPSPVGFDIITALKNRVNQLVEEGKATLVTSTRCKELLTEEKDGKLVVTGIKVTKEDGTEEDMLADAVVLASGGYACDFSDTSLIKQHRPDLYNLPTTNGPFAVGDGVKMGERAGCSLTLMDQLQVHPTSFVDPKNPCASVNFLGPEALRGCGGIMVNGKGERFFNELGRRDDVTKAVFEHCSKLPSHEGQPKCPTVAYLLMNEEACDKFGHPNLGFYKFKGFVRKFEQLEALSKEIGCEDVTLRKTLEEYGHQETDPFGKTLFPVLFKPDEVIWLCIITPALHYSMGGLEINPKGQILRKVGDKTEAIVNLYGAGEVTGGVHGGNRLAGNSLLECVVYGRIAGQQASSA